MVYDPAINHPEGEWGEPRSLLPLENPTLLDTAQEMADAARFPMQFGAPIRAKDPWSCDPRVLPFLAWEWSTDLWKQDWDLDKKRYVTSISLAMQRKKGTLLGFQQYVRVAGGELLRCDSPPLRSFPGRSMTADEYASWLATFKQLRSYEYSKRGNSQFALFFTKQKVVALAGAADPTGAGTAEGDLPGTSAGAVTTVAGFYPKPSQACLLSIDMSLYRGNQTYVYDPAGNKLSEVDVFTTTTPLGGPGKVLTEGAQYNVAVVPGSLADCWFLNHFPKDSQNTRAILMQSGVAGFFPVSYDLIAKRTVTTLTDEADYGSDNIVFTSVPVAPGLQPISIKPKQVMQIGQAKIADFFPSSSAKQVWPVRDGAAFAAEGAWGYFLTQDMSRFNIYTVLYLYNPVTNSAPPKMPPTARMFCDVSYFQYPAYQAYMRVAAYGTLPKVAMPFFYCGGYLYESDLTLMWDVVTAVRACKSARDLVLVDTQTYAIATPNAALRCGTIACGSEQPILEY